MNEKVENSWRDEKLLPAIKSFLNDDYYISSGFPLLHSVQVESHSILANGKQSPILYEYDCTRGKGGYETDITICLKKTQEILVPLLVIEVKIGGMTSHDMITYNNKSIIHKSLYPYLSYGIVVGDTKKGKMTLQKFNAYCSSFDFAYCFDSSNDFHQNDLAQLKDLLCQRLAISKMKYDLLAPNATRKQLKFYLKKEEF